ncbi:MAG: hypothetical protein JWO28_2493 [Hyphomicrobiales bacterium]|nr:hypothetical protein [Hyphomicrobiales bacterium]
MTIHAADDHGMLRAARPRHPALLALITCPAAIALAITAIYSIRFLNCLPFSGYTRLYNYETITTLTSYLLYVQEPFSFPLGVIKRLTFPFEDANVGNVGALPLFAVFFKAAGAVIPYFKDFDYVVLIELLFCFLTAYFSQLILIQLDVRSLAWRALGALLTATSLLILIRSASLQAFCVVSFPLFTGWMYGMLLTLRREHWRPGQDLLILSLFPAAALTDNYTLWGLLLGTAILAIREAFEAFFSELPAAWNRLARLCFYCAGGTAASLVALYLIGMYPLPPVSNVFTSYDFGMGGRYHVADLLAPFIPVGNKLFAFAVEPSLPNRLGFPITSDILGPGQYEGIGYIGTPMLLVWIVIGVVAIVSFVTRSRVSTLPHPMTIALYSPWTKIFIAAFCVFLFSLGYELHILGLAFPKFAGMPAAWIADRVPSLYNFRAPGRLAALLTLFLILQAVRWLSVWQQNMTANGSPRRVLWGAAIGLIALMHLVEVAPLLRPLKAQPLHPLGGIFTQQEITKLHQLAAGRDAVLVAPSVIAVDTTWTTTGFTLAYHMGIRSNLFYVARAIQSHADLLANDLRRILAGDWDAMTKEYGHVVFAIPVADAIRLRQSLSDRYHETVVGSVSVWTRR